MALYFALSDSDGSIRVTGKTYPYRDKMRSLGAQYNAVDKSWLVPNTPENASLIADLCRSVGGGPVKVAAVSRESLASWDSPPPPMATRESRAPTSLASFQAPSLPDLPAAGDGLELPQGYSIAELMREAQLAIAQSFPRSLWVIGEIQNIRFHGSGVYFQLADAKEGGSQSATVTVNATIWKSHYRELERKFGDALKDILQDGFRVRVLADLTLFKDRGQLSLQIQSIDPNFTKGSLALQREKLLKELRAKGLDRKNKALALTPFPLRIGLLSAEDSRAKSDFLDQLKVYAYPGDVLFKACQMQGEATVRDVIQGLRCLESEGVDLVVITRGGGSAADLRWFDSPEIAYAIAASPIPIVCAIGHHEDTCVAEEICFQREKTPTAAADYVISRVQKTRERLEQISLYLDKTLSERVKLFEAYLMGVMERMRSFAQAQLSDQRRLADQAEASLELNWQRRLLGLKARLDQQTAQLDRGLELRVAKEEALLEKAASTIQTRGGLVIERQEARLAELARDLKRSTSDAVRTQEHGLQRIEAAIQQKDPKPWMQQGWTQLFDERGLVRDSSQLTLGQELKARLTDSLLSLTLKDIERPKEGKH